MALRGVSCGVAKDRLGDVIGGFGSVDDDGVTLFEIAEPRLLAFRELASTRFDCFFQPVD